jgi:uncharacterized membrane protein (UPF0127 family)
MESCKGEDGRAARAACYSMKQTYYVFNKTRESFLGLDVSCASTTIERLRGLLGKFRIGSGEGVWLIPSQGVHTIGVMFPIDLIYLDADYAVVHLVEHLRPFSISPICLKSSSLLELPAHTIYTSQTKVGDRMLICRADEMEAYLANTNSSPEAAKAQEGAAGS